MDLAKLQGKRNKLWRRLNLAFNKIPKQFLLLILFMLPP